ncbi:hypothetical protein [Thalassospira sp. MCCC 1A03138]|uniref:hypothetical protein n=1 Tax=Thalassospira sp. MCCC 1A03138 TaxID=1470576 RepID=UPI000A1FBD94|nr:hypothetical protein [Thalassospira sp. MCCC 1A03138]OSQ32271.1 hypothetical protein TH468_01175 [Thalassospira sp. MCCC 1A03138]
MGSLFSTPKPAAPPPIATSSSANPPSVDDVESAAEAARRARSEALERRRYGRAGLIGTGFRGLLSDRIDRAAGGKNLLGD